VLGTTFLLACSLFSSSCRTVSEEVASGVSQAYRGFVPARTAVVPCRPWPNGASLAEQPLSVEDEDVIGQLCEQFDDFVIEGYQDQPFMRGYSPRAVARLLELAEHPDYLDQVSSLWQRDSDACSSCRQPASFYQTTIAKRQNWRIWLQGLSRHTRNTDAVLMPFVVYAAEGRFDDRGLFTAQRRAQIVLLLIDSNNGNLIWSGGRSAEVSQQVLHTAGKVEELTFPE